MGAGAAEGATVELDSVPALGEKEPRLQVSLRGAKVTLSPFMPVTSLPLTAVEPDPRRVLSEATARVKGPPLFWTCTRNCGGSIFDGVGSFDVGEAAVQDHGGAAEVQQQARGAGVLADDAEAGFVGGSDGAHHA